MTDVDFNSDFCTKKFLITGQSNAIVRFEQTFASEIVARKYDSNETCGVIIPHTGHNLV
jgi:hypothetical protein